VANVATRAPERGDATSRRKKANLAVAPQPPPAPALSPPPRSEVGIEAARRLLLAVVTALVVAQPQLADEDPGVLNPFSSTAGLVLTLLWFVAGFGGAVWVAWSGRDGFRLPVVEAALLAVVALVYVAGLPRGRYHHPALLIGWQWLALLVAFWLVRRLVGTQADMRRLLAILVAGALSLSVQAVYQYAWELPPQWQAYQQNPTAIHDELARQGFFLDNADPRLDFWTDRYAEQSASATFVQPEAFAAYLILLLPAAVGWAVAARESPRRSWHAIVAAGLVLLVAVSLWLTHRWLAVAACLVVGAAAVVLQGRAWLVKHRRGLLASAVGFVVVMTAAVWWQGNVLGDLRDTLRGRLETWSATWGMVHDHPWLGVGPGNFSRYYPRYMSPPDQEDALAPHSFTLEMWSTAGVFTLGALLTALGLFFWRTRTAWAGLSAHAGKDQPAADGAPPPSGPRAPLEYYVGGMVGLVLAYVLWAADQSPGGLGVGTVVFGVRAAVWFAAFAFLDAVPWPGRSRAVAVIAGVATLLLYLLVADGIEFASVALPLWIMAALALNAVDTPAPASLPARLLPVPVLAAVCVAYVATAFLPVVGSRRLVQEINRLAGPAYRQRMQQIEHLQHEAEQTKTNEDKRPRLQKEMEQAGGFLRKDVLEPLREAMRRDPTDVLPKVAFAEWYLERLRFLPPMEEDANFGRLLSQMRRIDPQGKEVHLAEYSMYMAFARSSRANRTELYEKAADAMANAVRLAPTEARLRFRLAEALFLTGKVTRARQEARQARELDRLASRPWRRLSDVQRRKVEEWLGPKK
jgi:hypothetical protein